MGCSYQKPRASTVYLGPWPVRAFLGSHTNKGNVPWSLLTSSYFNGENPQEPRNPNFGDPYWRIPSPLNGVLLVGYLVPYPRNLRTHILRPWGPKTILYKAFGLFWCPGILKLRGNRIRRTHIELKDPLWTRYFILGSRWILYSP